jgi:uncharacterized protein YjbJ (UPF0337 family)
VGSSTDKASGRIKQAIGALTGDEKLKRDGRHDESAGRAKQKADETIDVVRDKLEEVADTLSSSERESE